MEYVELQVTSNFSFLRGGSHPEELMERAASLKYAAIAIADINTVAGVVRAHVTAKKHGIKFIPACHLVLLDGPDLLAYPTCKHDWEELCTLLTKGNMRTEKGKCELKRQDVFEHAAAIKFVVIPPTVLNDRFDFDDTFKAAVHHYNAVLGNQLYIAASRSYNGEDEKRLYRMAQLGIPMIATNDVYYHEAARRELQDVLTCVREKCTVRSAGFKLHQNAERFLKPVMEMHRFFRLYPEAIAHSIDVANACHFSLDDLKYIYPEEITSEGRTPQEELVMLTWEGAHRSFPDGIADKIKAAINKELDFIERKNYAAYFLTVYDLVRFARSRNILCQGRGSAANSVVCYCLGVTSVDPSKFNLLFARFMSEARNEPPDIDVDFEHERREEVIQYIYEKYGRDRAGIVATVTQERYKGAIRDVGKAMGLSVDTINRLSGSVWSYSGETFDRQRIIENGLNPDDRELLKVMELTGKLMGFPRQLGQHTGGFVITQNKLYHLCPVLHARMEDRTCIEWNKDDIEALGFLKVDVLALGMLTCIRKAFDLVEQHYGEHLTLANVKQDEPGVYDMICRADTIGVFQIESRAQMSMLPRLQPREFYDLVIEVAIVRPGPIQGDMVHPYLQRRKEKREGKQTVEYPKDELIPILNRTLGIPLFQEQAMEISIVAAEFTEAEADVLRRSMATFKAKGKVSEFEQKLVQGMVRRGYEEEYAKRVFRQLEGFGSYGFPESHAVSFALLAYISSYLKWKYPDVFAAALLNSQPMGFYQPAQIIMDARKHEVEVRPVDVNLSMWDNTLETSEGASYAIRLGFRQIKGMNAEDAVALIKARLQAYTAVTQLVDAGVSQFAIEKLADADAFQSMGLDRRSAWWEVPALQDMPTGMYAGHDSESAAEPQLMLPFMSPAEHVVEDYAVTGLSLKAHPVSFVREKLNMLGITPNQRLENLYDGAIVKVAGLVLVRQRPGTAKGICFITIEDEGGIANLVVFEKLFDKFKKEILRSQLLMVTGKLQIEGKPDENKVIHVVVHQCFNITGLLQDATLSSGNNMPVLTLSRADEKTDTPDPGRKQAEAENVFYKGRNFK